jgi:hypothetical protein
MKIQREKEKNNNNFQLSGTKRSVDCDEGRFGEVKFLIFKKKQSKKSRCFWI